MLLRARDDASLRIGQRVVLVDIDADAPDLRAACGSQRACASETGDLEDDIGALADHRLRRGLTFVWGVEVLGVVHRDLTIRVLLLGRVLVPLDVVRHLRYVRPSAY